MDPATLRTLAEALAGLGALVVVAMTANLLALRSLSPDEVPSCVRARVQWWRANTSTVLCVGVVLTVLGLSGMAATVTL